MRKRKVNKLRREVRLGMQELARQAAAPPEAAQVTPSLWRRAKRTLGGSVPTTAAANAQTAQRHATKAAATSARRLEEQLDKRDRKRLARLRQRPTAPPAPPPHPHNLRAGRVNHWICDLGHVLRSVDVDQGTTPFLLSCPTPGCGRDARSCFYGVPQDGPPPEWEWYKPTGRQRTAAMREHVARGGLMLRRRQTTNPQEGPPCTT